MSRPPRGGRGRRPWRGKRKGPPFKSETFDVTVAVIGGRGDGVAEVDGRRLYIPYTAPGDVVRVTTTGAQGDGLSAQVDDLIAPGPMRTDPVCPHFGICGGCALQHLTAAAQSDWKRAQIEAALARRGLETAVDVTVSVAPGTRRRVSWAVDSGTVGFTARASHRLVAIDMCPLLVPPLNALLAQVSALVARLPGVVHVQATAVDNGIDVLLTGPAALDLAAREVLSDFATEAGLARLSWRADPDTLWEPVAQRVVPLVSMAGIPVEFPPGGFLQPSVAGEAALTKPVASWIAGAANVADLFAGLGTFSCAILAAGGANVHAVEAEAEVLEVLDRAVGHVGKGGRLRTEARDLFQQPLTVKELERFDAVVFDPPRSGAAAQAERLAVASAVRRVVAVSCNPSTFARDVRALVDGGFRLERVVPVDQFPFAAHVEVVGLLARPYAKER